MVKNWKTFAKSDLGKENPQRVIYWVETYTTCHILNQHFYKASNFESCFLQCLRFWIGKFLEETDFWKNLAEENHVLIHLTPQKRQTLEFLCIFVMKWFRWEPLGIRFWTKNIKTCPFVNRVHFTKWQVLRKNWPSKKESYLNPPHKLFVFFSSIVPRAIRACKNLIQEIIAIAVQTTDF